jgi:AhpD family alkylhydroperoxidase
MPGGRPTIPYRDFTPAMGGLSRVHSAVNDSALPRPIVDLVRVRASQMNRCSYCIQVHWREALDHGVEDAKLALLPAWRHASAFTPREHAALAMTEAVTTLACDEAITSAARRAADVYDDDELAALLVAIAEINAWNRLAIGGGRHAQ